MSSDIGSYCAWKWKRREYDQQHAFDVIACVRCRRYGTGFRIHCAPLNMIRQGLPYVEPSFLNANFACTERICEITSSGKHTIKQMQTRLWGLNNCNMTIDGPITLTISGRICCIDWPNEATSCTIHILHHPHVYTATISLYMPRRMYGKCELPFLDGIREKQSDDFQFALNTVCNLP